MVLVVPDEPRWLWVAMEELSCPLGTTGNSGWLSLSLDGSGNH